jgi:hypothetical protein
MIHKLFVNFLKLAAGVIWGFLSVFIDNGFD